jgi:hypothetical protein
MPVALSDKINYNAAVAKKMDKIFQSYDKVEPFTSSFQLSNLFYLYLFKKYKTECLILDQNIKWRMHFSLNLSDLSKEDWFYHFNADQIETIKKTAKAVSECIIKGVKIIIMPLTFQTSFGAHANLLVYRANAGVIEHFEPHGYKYGGEGAEYVVRMLNNYLDHFVKLINKDIKAYNKTLNAGEEKLPKITLVKAHDVCPVISGVQDLEGASTIPKNALIEPGGYCEAWTMFFTELCLKNPEMSSREVYEAVMDKTELYENKNDYLRNVIRGYTAFINNKIEKHFSRVFDEPITSAKVHSIVKERKAGILTMENKNYINKLLEIMEVEKGDNFVETAKPRTDVKERYIEFTQGIRPETSSSSLKSADRVSPKRKGETSSLRKKSSTITKKASQKDTNKDALLSFSLIDKKKMSVLIKEDRQKNAAAKQREKEEKAIERSRKATEKLASKTEKSRAKSASKAKTLKMKSTHRSETEEV